MRILSAVVLSLVASASAAQQFVYPRTDPSRITVTRDIPYQSAGGGVHQFDLYRPAGSAIVPVVITGNVGIQGMRTWPGYVGWGEATAAAGLAAIHYDGPGNFIENFDALVGELRKRAGELRIDPSRIVVWGGSTNVRVALPVAMDPKREYIRGAVIYYGDAEVSQLSQKPVFFVRAGLDRPDLNTRIDTLLQRALQSNAPWTIVNYGGGLHGFDILNDNDVSRDIIRRTLDFMIAVTAEKLASAYAASGDDAVLGATFARGEWEASVKAYSRRVAANDRDAESHLRLGIAQYETGSYSAALENLERAWVLGRMGPRDTGLPAARAAAKARNLERAAHWLGLVLRTPFVTIDDVRKDAAFAGVLESDPIRALFTGIEQQTQVVSMFNAGDRSAAIKMLRSSSSIHLTNEAALNVIGYRLLTAGRIEEAVDVFELAAERYPQSANAWESLSEGQEAAGKRSEAVASARRALDLDGPEPVRAAAKSRVDRLEQ